MPQRNERLEQQDHERLDEPREAATRPGDTPTPDDNPPPTDDGGNGDETGDDEAQTR